MVDCVCAPHPDCGRSRVPAYWRPYSSVPLLDYVLTRFVQSLGKLDSFGRSQPAGPLQTAPLPGGRGGGGAVLRDPSAWEPPPSITAPVEFAQFREVHLSARGAQLVEWPTILIVTSGMLRRPDLLRVHRRPRRLAREDAHDLLAREAPGCFDGRLRVVRHMWRDDNLGMSD